MKVVKVVVPDIEVLREGNIITPTRRVRVILENGAIYERSFFGFSVDENFVVQNFKEEPANWKKYEPNK